MATLALNHARVAQDAEAWENRDVWEAVQGIISETLAMDREEIQVTTRFKDILP